MKNSIHKIIIGLCALALYASHLVAITCPTQSIAIKGLSGSDIGFYRNACHMQVDNTNTLLVPQGTTTVEAGHFGARAEGVNSLGD